MILFIVSLAYSPTVAASGPHMLADFETGMPAGWFVYDGASTPTAITETVAASSPLALLGQVGTNGILSVTYNISTFGGLGVNFGTATLYGNNSGLTYQAEIFDNGADTDNAERFDFNFVDNTTGWRHIEIPFGAFTRAVDYNPGGAPNDGLTLTQMHGWAMPLPGPTNFMWTMSSFMLTLFWLTLKRECLPVGLSMMGLALQLPSQRQLRQVRLWSFSAK